MSSNRFSDDFGLKSSVIQKQQQIDKKRYTSVVLCVLVGWGITFGASFLAVAPLGFTIAGGAWPPGPISLQHGLLRFRACVRALVFNFSRYWDPQFFGRWYISFGYTKKKLAPPAHKKYFSPRAWYSHTRALEWGSSPV